MEPLICGWTLISSIWSLGQYHRCIEQEATALLFSRQVFNGIIELAPPVFNPLKCIFFFFFLPLWEGESLLNAENSVSIFYLYSWACDRPQALASWQTLFRKQNRDQAMHNTRVILLIFLFITCEDITYQLQCQTLHIKVAASMNDDVFFCNINSVTCSPNGGMQI